MNKHNNLRDLIVYQEGLVNNFLNKFVKEESTYNKRALIRSKIQLDAYKKAYELPRINIGDFD